MKFLRYLQEEYFAMTSAGDFTIFLNPSQSEKNETIQVSKEDGYGGRVRLLIDRKTHDIYLFPAALLHDRACKIIDKPKARDYGKYFYALMGMWYQGKFHFTIFEADDLEKDEQESYEVLKKKGWNPQIGFDDIPDSLWEEYVTSFTAKLHGPGSKFIGGHTEIFKNPSKKEITDLIRNSGVGAIRYYADLANQDLYIWKADTVHYMGFDELRKEGIEIDGRNIIQGVAIVKAGKLAKAYKSDTQYYDSLHYRNDSGCDLSYLDKYFAKGTFDDLKE